MGVVPEDLTARARIREAAMRHFAEHGFERATIRGIAETAGVSSGLIRHHFGSKQDLREACDQHLARMLHRLNDQVEGDLGLEAGVNPLSVAREGPYQAYLARALVEGSAAGVFDEMVAMTERWVARVDRDRSQPKGVDVRSRAAVMTAMALAVGILGEHVGRHLGVDPDSRAGELKLARTLIEVYSYPWMSQEDADSVHAGLDRLEERGEPG
jgi:AcrR family transcriptional regulator